MISIDEMQAGMAAVVADQFINKSISDFSYEGVVRFLVESESDQLPSACVCREK